MKETTLQYSKYDTDKSMFLHYKITRKNHNVLTWSMF